MSTGDPVSTGDSVGMSAVRNPRLQALSWIRFLARENSETIRNSLIFADSSLYDSACVQTSDM